jgi:hypothetical protein
MKDLLKSSPEPANVRSRNWLKKTRRAYLILSALFAVTFVKLGLKLLSFRSFQKLFKFIFLNFFLSISGSPTASEAQGAVKASCRFLPIKATCLERALAAKLLLRPRTEIRLHVGVRHGPQQELLAHAWLVQGDMTFDLTDGLGGIGYETLWVWEP